MLTLGRLLLLCPVVLFICMALPRSPRVAWADSGDLTPVSVTHDCLRPEDGCSDGMSYSDYRTVWPEWMAASPHRFGYTDVGPGVYLPASIANGMTLTCVGDCYVALYKNEVMSPSSTFLMQLDGVGASTTISGLASAERLTLVWDASWLTTLHYQTATGVDPTTTTSTTTTTTAPTTTTSTTTTTVPPTITTTTTTTTAPPTTSSSTTTTTTTLPVDAQAVAYNDFGLCETAPGGTLPVEAWASCSVAYNTDRMRQFMTSALWVIVCLLTTLLVSGLVLRVRS